MARKRKAPVPPGQDEAALLAKEERVWELRSRGWTQARIAAEMGLDQSTVSRTLVRVTERVAKEFPDRVAAEKERQTAVLELIADEALQAWEQSRQQRRAGSKRVTRKPGEGGVEETEVLDSEVADQCGDPAYLDAAREALADIRAIWGVEAPKELRHTGSGEGGAILITSIEAVAPPPVAPDQALPGLTGHDLDGK